MRVPVKSHDIKDKVFPPSGYLAYENETVEIRDGREMRTIHAVFCAKQTLVFIRGYYFKYSYKTSQFKIIKDGVEHIRNYPKYYSLKTISSLSRRFAEEVYK